MTIKGVKKHPLAQKYTDKAKREHNTKLQLQLHQLKFLGVLSPLVSFWYATNLSRALARTRLHALVCSEWNKLAKNAESCSTLNNLWNTVKPVLTATSEQRPPVNNDRPKSPALIIILRLYQVFWTNLWTTATLWTTVTFSGSQGWPLYTGLTVYSE